MCGAFLLIPEIGCFRQRPRSWQVYRAHVWPLVPHMRAQPPVWAGENLCAPPNTRAHVFTHTRTLTGTPPCTRTRTHTLPGGHPKSHATVAGGRQVPHPSAPFLVRPPERKFPADWSRHRQGWTGFPDRHTRAQQVLALLLPGCETLGKL